VQSIAGLESRFCRCRVVQLFEDRFFGREVGFKVLVCRYDQPTIRRSATPAAIARPGRVVLMDAVSVISLMCS
jgi:hypothetical protein